MTRLLVLLTVLAGLFFWLPTFGITADHLVISQVQITGGPGKTTNDFIELFNPTSEDIDLKGMRLVKRTKEGQADTLLKSWTESTIIKARGYYLWANKDYTDISIVPDVTTSGSIANDNGIALRQGANDTGTVIDSVAWGSAANIFVEGSVFPSNPGANESLQRNQDTNHNAADFISSQARPRNSSSFTVETPSPMPPLPQPEPLPTPTPPTPTPQPAPPPSKTPNGSLGGQAPSTMPSPPSPSPSPSPARGEEYKEVRISELFPDPTGGDAAGEFIELENYGTKDADLSGWQVVDQKGNFKIADQTILPAGNYLVLYLDGKAVSLNNSGDTLQLKNRQGGLVSQTSYPEAPEGQSYSWKGGTYSWTTSPTPGGLNRLTVPKPAEKQNEPVPSVVVAKVEEQPLEIIVATSTAAEVLGTSTPAEPVSKAASSWIGIAGLVAGGVLGVAAALWFRRRQSLP